MDSKVFEATLLYVTNRKKFNERYGESGVEGGFLNEIFIESESRPDLAERISIAAVGYIPSQGKKGYDGYTPEGRPIEAKVRNFVSTNGIWPRPSGTLTINDVSWNIVERYVNDNPLMLISYFYDGHMSTVFEFDYLNIHHCYVDCLKKHKIGRCSFKLGITPWIDIAKPIFIHEDTEVLNLLPKTILNKVQSTRYFNKTIDNSRYSFYKSLDNSCNFHI